MSLTCLDDYNDALNKLKRAEDTSDIQTDIKGSGAKKKKSHSATITLLESSDEEEEVRQVPPAPKIRRTLFVDGNFLHFYDVKINNTEILKQFFFTFL